MTCYQNPGPAHNHTKFMFFVMSAYSNITKETDFRKNLQTYFNFHNNENGSPFYFITFIDS